jgi:site-specific recombinase XerC
MTRLLTLPANYLILKWSQRESNFATRFIEAGGDLETLRKLMGHADTKTLGKYLHVSPEHVRKQAGLVRFGG